MSNFKDTLKVAAVQYFIENNYNNSLNFINIFNREDIIYFTIQNVKKNTIETYELNTFLKNLEYKKSDFYNFLNYINDTMVFEVSSIEEIDENDIFKINKIINDAFSKNEAITFYYEGETLDGKILSFFRSEDNGDIVNVEIDIDIDTDDSMKIVLPLNQLKVAIFNYQNL